jgi:glycosyltransferase involved in cell wall biosynthesis
MESPMRVLHIVSGLRRGGTEQYLMNLYRHIDRSLVQFDFLVLSEQAEVYEQEIESLGGRVYRIPPVTRRPLENLIARNRFFKGHRYRIVEIHSSSPLRFSYAKDARRAGVERILFHAHNAVDKPKSIAHRFAARRIGKWCDEELACSHVAGEYVYADSDYVIIPNAIDLDRFRFNSETRSRLRTELQVNDAFVLGTVGRLSRQKNYDFLLQVYASLWPKIDDSILLMVGSGELRDSLEMLSHSLGINDRVRFLNDRRDVPDLLSVFDLFIMTSFYEGLSIAAVEAQAAGLPCFFSSAISEETAFSDKVKFMPLDAGPDSWARAIADSMPTGRMNSTETLRHRGYDINDLAQRMQSYYLGEADLR